MSNRENRKSQDTRKESIFLFCQNFPTSGLIQEKIVLGSSDSLYGKINKKFEKSIYCWFFALKNNRIRPHLRENGEHIRNNP